MYKLKLVIIAHLFLDMSLCMEITLSRTLLLLHKYSSAQSIKTITIENRIVIKWKYWPRVMITGKSGKEELKILRKKQWENKVSN